LTEWQLNKSVYLAGTPRQLRLKTQHHYQGDLLAAVPLTSIVFVTVCRPIKPPPANSSSNSSGGSKGSAAAAAAAAAAAVANKVGCLDAVAKATKGYSGSDLMELAAQAAQNVLVQHWAAHPEGTQPLRALNAHDLLSTATTVRPGVTRAQEYSAANVRSSSSHWDQAPLFDGSSGSNGGSSAAGMAQLMAAAAAAAAAQSRGSSSAGAAKANGTAAGDATAAAAAAGAGDANGDVSSSSSSAQDEVYKMVGKMVLNSLSWQQ
jgi:hypothetical protein